MIYIQNGKGNVISVTEEKWAELKKLGWDKYWTVTRVDKSIENEKIQVEPVRKLSKKEKVNIEEV